MRRLLITAGLAAALSGCAAAGGPVPPGAAMAADPGLRFAQRACAGCHALDAGESPRAAAPNFATLRLRFSSVALERHLAEISAHGHYEMPPIYITKDEARSLAAYVQGLRS